MGQHDHASCLCPRRADLNKAEIVSKLESHIATDVLKQPGRRIAEDLPIISSGLIDSFNLVDLALYVEDTFGVRIEDTELTAQTFDSLSQLADIIASRMI